MIALAWLVFLIGTATAGLGPPAVRIAGTVIWLLALLAMAFATRAVIRSRTR